MLARALGVALWMVAGVAGPRAARAEDAALGVLRGEGAGIGAEQVAALDEALIEALREAAGHGEPMVLPVSLVDAQLTVGCDGVDGACLSALAGAAQVDALIVRELDAPTPGTTRLRLSLGRELDGAWVSEQREASAADDDALVARVPAMVRALFGAPQEEPGRPVPAPAAAPPPATAAPTATQPVGPTPAAPVSQTTAATREVAAGERAPGIAPVSWVLTGTGVLVLSAGIAVGLTADARFEDVQRSEVETREDAARVRADFDEVESLGTAANVLIPVGAAVLATGLVLVVLDLSAEPEPVAPLALGIAPRPGGAMVVIEGRVDAGP